jgi:hypothetical protein
MWFSPFPPDTSRAQILSLGKKNFVNCPKKYVFFFDYQKTYRRRFNVCTEETIKNSFFNYAFPLILIWQPVQMGFNDTRSSESISQKAFWSSNYHRTIFLIDKYHRKFERKEIYVFCHFFSRKSLRLAQFEPINLSSGSVISAYLHIR